MKYWTFYLKDDGVTFQAAHVLEYGVNYLVIFVPLQEARPIFFEEVDEIVEQEICACKR